MIANEEAAWEIHQLLVNLNAAYAIIGGMAVQFWGEARFTKDVDLTVVVPIEHQERLLQALIDRLPPRREDAIELARKHRIYLTQTSKGFPVDISIGLPGYEEELVARAVDYKLKTGHTVRLCSAEDLIIHKAVAGRPQDVYDIQSIIVRQASALDLSYIRTWLRIFSEWLETDDVIDRFEQAWLKYGPAS